MLRMTTVGRGWLLLVVVGCGGGSQTPETPAPDDGGRAFQEFVKALDNTLIEVNELERMGGGFRDRMILVDARTLVKSRDQLRYFDVLRLNYGKIRTLRASMVTNEGIREVMTRAGRSLDELVAIDAKSEGVVILYYNER